MPARSPSSSTRPWRANFPRLPARSPSTRRTPPPDLRAAPRRQTSVRREACPPARRPRRELRSARRLEARPGPAGLAPPSSRAAMTTGIAATSTPAGLAPPSSRAARTTWPCHRPPAPQPLPPMPQPHQPRRQIPHRIRTTPSGLDNSRINKPSTTCAQPQDLTKARQRGDVETNNTTARPQQRTAETGDTSAPGKCTKNNHFSPAEAMAVSTPHRHTRAKATGVSDNRAASLTGTGSATHSH